MVKTLFDLIAIYFIGSLAINIIEELGRLRNPEMRKAIKKFNVELQEYLNNRIPEEEEVEEEVEEESTNNDE